MKKLLFTIGCLLILSSCNQQRKTENIIKSDTIYIVKGNDIDIKLNVANDSVMGMQYGEVGNALFCFEKRRTIYRVRKWSL